MKSKVNNKKFNCKKFAIIFKTQYIKRFYLAYRQDDFVF